ncbi:hypothetical protein [Methylobacterium sp. GC_Met_2]|uniref:hypothetical protein n=1 Tax=Methylobacterium sp. GC_Met_2 TaxID=2937376 RepID=UPI00226B421F|nr:hypothetical protein [Methylobacterium sp. GC_Met_2]
MSELSPTVASWRDQIERLSEHASQCRYLLPTKWPPMRAAALAFLDQFGAEAHGLGWTAPQLFGVHPQHGFQRVEYVGALMGNVASAIGVEADRIVFERFSGYRTKIGQVWGIPVWEFVTRSR